jgi:hypothetical protein
MPNDAKLGLVVGVSLVIFVAVVFFRKDASSGANSVAPAPTNGVQPAPAPTNNRIVVASPAGHQPENNEPAPTETRLLEREMTRGLPRLDSAVPATPAPPEDDAPN